MTVRWRGDLKEAAERWLDYVAISTEMFEDGLTV